MDKKQAVQEVKKLVKKGDIIYCILDHVSQSGMMRHISFFVIKKNTPIRLNWYISHILDYKLTKEKSLKVSGCGMDMGFSVVYNLSQELFKNGYHVKHSWL